MLQSLASDLITYESDLLLKTFPYQKTFHYLNSDFGNKFGLQVNTFPCQNSVLSTSVFTIAPTLDIVQGIIFKLQSLSWPDASGIGDSVGRFSALFLPGR